MIINSKKQNNIKKKTTTTNKPEDMKKNLVFKTVLFLSAIFSMALLYEKDVILTLILIIIFIMGIRGKLKKYDLSFFIGGGIIGASAEIICVQFNCWQYTHPTFLDIPLWLPIAWGITSVFIKRVTEKLQTIN